MVLEPAEDPRPFEAVLRKLAAYLQAMEVESGALSQPAHRARLQEVLLPAILHGLNSRGECFVRVGAGDTVALKLFPVLAPPPDVEDHDVPYPTRNLDMLVGNGEDSGLDYAMRVILPHIDGLNFVRAIAERSNVDVSLVRRCCQHLLYYGCVALVDVFQYSNVYATLPRVQLLVTSDVLRESAVSYIAKAPPRGVMARSASLDESAGGGDGGVAFGVIFRIFAAFGAGTPVGDVALQADTAALGIDDRRLTAFGLLHGLLRRVRKYPTPLERGSDAAEESGRHSQIFALPPEPVSASGDLTGSVHRGGGSGAATASEAASVDVSLTATALLSADVLELLDGSRHLEQLCCRLRCSCDALEAAIAAHGGFTYVLK